MSRDSFSITLGVSATRSKQTIHLDASTLVDSRALMMANSGGGKSWLFRLAAEQAAPSMQIIVIDPEGEFGTLRERVDVVLVGPGGDLAAEVRTAPMLARKIMELSISAVLDISELSLQDRRAFVRAFLQSLMALPKTLWQPCLIFLDEAHRFAPERSSGQSEATDAVITLLSQGRKRGYAGILATQRISKLHKDAAAECNNVFVGRTSLDVDVHRARDLLGMGKDGEDALRSLAPGEWFGFGPALDNVDGRVCRFTAAKVKTTHPRSGQRHRIQAPAPSAKIKKVLPEFAAIPREIQEAQDELVSLRSQVKSLKKELRAQAHGPAPALVPVEAHVPRKQLEAVLRDHRQSMERFSKGLTAHARKLDEILRLSSQLGKVHGDLTASAEGLLGGLRTEPGNWTLGGKHQAEPAPVAAASQRARRGKPPPVTTSVGGGGQARMLAVLVQNTVGCDRLELAIRSGMTPGGGTFAKYLSNLRSAGHVEDAGGKLVATAEGYAALGSAPQMPDGEALISMWQEMLGGGGIRRMFDALVHAGDEGLARSELAEVAELDPSGGTFAKYLSTLCSKMQVAHNDRRRIVIHPVFR